MRQMQKIIINFIGLNIIATTLFTTFRNEYFELDSIPVNINIEK